MTISRRGLLQAAGLAAPALLGLGRTPAWALADRAITLVAPVARGGAIDAAARLTAERLARKLGVPVVVDNRPGSAGAVGSRRVAQAAPDGATLLFMEPGAAISQVMRGGAPFDLLRDFTPIALVARSPLVLFAHPSLPASSLTQLLALPAAELERLYVGTPGTGSPHHLALAWLNASKGLNLVHVPYSGAAASLRDLLDGSIKLAWASPGPVMPLLAQGRLKALAVSTPQRFRLLPEVETVAEAGVPGFDLSNWAGIAGPARLPSDMAARLAGAAREMLEEPELRQRFEAAGFEVAAEDSAAFGATLARERGRYREIMRSIAGPAA